MTHGVDLYAVLDRVECGPHGAAFGGVFDVVFLRNTTSATT
jgi:hypothetical protein